MPPISDQDWDEMVAQEIPKPSDPVIQQYLQSRQALMDEEHKQRSDYSFRQSLSPIAKEACAIVSRIRDEEQRTIWTASLEEQLAQDPSSSRIVFPGMMFNLAKDLMESTTLWKIIRKMPKGGLLHAHCDAMVPIATLLAIALTTPGMHLSSPVPLSTPSSLHATPLSIRFRQPLPSPPPPGSIWTDAYQPETYIPLTDAADAFPGGGRDGFCKWLYSRCVLAPGDAVNQHHGQDAIWEAFGRCFQVLGEVIHYEPVWRAFLQKLMALLATDGVSWVELRFTWPLNYCREGREEPESDYNHMFTVIEEEVVKFKATDEGAGFWGIRMIWASFRQNPIRHIINDMENCIMTKLEWPHLIAGYDLVGPEDDGRALTDLLPELFWFRKQCAVEGVELPFFFHAGECLGDGDEVDNNLYDALLLGTRRIGHGFSLYKHPRLIQAVRDKRVLIESCPISNEVLRLTGSIMQHPLPALLARGVACSLCNDDPAILGQDAAGMTHDFWQALQGWENLGLAGLGSLAENSVRWAAFEDQDNEAWTRDIRAASVGGGIKGERLRQWSVEWERFCLWIVTEYGEKYGETGKAGDAL
ncbi:adenosine deaminase-related growth factor [Lasiosphaeris hirsuta]|uniref:adenosine deaminase n=1 Tax=Lasiosphaeris hirsuta TaxID=260670 RepID=A0AA40APG2_9PEZI|nr:adenosine deaminase-related growth factor [Lasiosphaeris hirsuta]